MLLLLVLLLRWDAEVSFLLKDLSSVLFELELELVEDELCFFSYSSRSSLRFCSHWEFCCEPPFLNLQIFNVTVVPWIPRPTANSALHPFNLVGAFKI